MWARSCKFYKGIGIGLSVCWLASAAGEAGQPGQALFFGKEPLTGKIRQHATALPAEVVVCAHCHNNARGKTQATSLDRAYLLAPQSRRAGPPSAYDQPKFCRLLRTGVDPAYILIAREMPVYTLTEEQCGSLWRFLTNNAKSDGKP